MMVLHIFNNLHCTYAHHHPVLRIRTVLFGNRPSPHSKAQTKYNFTQLCPKNKDIFNLRAYAWTLRLFATWDDGKYPYNEYPYNEYPYNEYPYNEYPHNEYPHNECLHKENFLTATYRVLFPSWRVSFRLQGWSGFQKALARHPAEGSIARP